MSPGARLGIARLLVATGISCRCSSRSVIAWSRRASPTLLINTGHHHGLPMRLLGWAVSTAALVVGLSLGIPQLRRSPAPLRDPTWRCLGSGLLGCCT